MAFHIATKIHSRLSAIFMKKIFVMRNAIVLAFSFLPFLSIGQTQKDYVNIMQRFMAFYNAGEPDSMCTLFSPNPELPTGCFWTWAEQPKKNIDVWGRMESYKFLGMVKPRAYDSVAVFKVDYVNRKRRIMFFSLTSGLKFFTFTFDGVTNETDRMLENDKD